MIKNIFYCYDDKKYILLLWLSEIYLIVMMTKNIFYCNVDQEIYSIVFMRKKIYFIVMMTKNIFYCYDDQKYILLLWWSEIYFIVMMIISILNCSSACIDNQEIILIIMMFRNRFVFKTNNKLICHDVQKYILFWIHYNYNKNVRINKTFSICLM